MFYSQAFTNEDTHHTGTISGPALHEILNEHAFRMSSDQFSYIWSKLPKNAEGKVDYRDFLKIFSTRTDVIRVASTTPPQSRDRRVSSPLSNFYKLVSAEKIPFPTPVELQRLFQFLISIYIDKFALIRFGLALILRMKKFILFFSIYIIKESSFQRTLRSRWFCLVSAPFSGEAARAPAGTSAILRPILPGALRLGRAPVPNKTTTYTGLFKEKVLL